MAGDRKSGVLGQAAAVATVIGVVLLGATFFTGKNSLPEMLSKNEAVEMLSATPSERAAAVGESLRQSLLDAADYQLIRFPHPIDISGAGEPLVNVLAIAKRKIGGRDPYVAFLQDDGTNRVEYRVSSLPHEADFAVVKENPLLILVVGSERGHVVGGGEDVDDGFGVKVGYVSLIHYEHGYMRTFRFELFCHRVDTDVIRFSRADVMSDRELFFDLQTMCRSIHMEDARVSLSSVMRVADNYRYFYTPEDVDTDEEMRRIFSNPFFSPTNLRFTVLLDEYGRVSSVSPECLDEVCTPTGDDLFEFYWEMHEAAADDRIGG